MEINTFSIINKYNFLNVFWEIRLYWLCDWIAMVYVVICLLVAQRLYLFKSGALARYLAEKPNVFAYR